MKYLKRILTLLAIVLFLAISGFLFWAETPLGPAPEALSALQPDAQVKVTNGDWISFEPTASTPNTGFIFYPGGHVDYRSYAPVLKKIAAQGYFVALLKVPLNLAFFSTNAALPVFDAHPEITHWAVGGHSLGGVAAAIFVADHPDKISGIAFWASYPANDKLLHTNIKITSIYGTNDGLGTIENIKKAATLLPANVVYVPIAGGNHGQFGAYGPQPGDKPATISAEEQWNQTATATIQMLKSITP